MHAPSMQTIGFIHKYIEICKNQWQPMIIHENHWLLYGIYTLQWQTHFNHILITRSAQSSPQAFELKRLEHTSPTTSQESHFLKNVFWLQHFFFHFWWKHRCFIFRCTFGKSQPHAFWTNISDFPNTPHFFHA